MMLPQPLNFSIPCIQKQAKRKQVGIRAGKEERERIETCVNVQLEKERE